jgi:citrate synthase
MDREPSPSETTAIDACLVALMEHGVTPTVVTTRITYTSAPEAMQGAVAAGLSSVGSLYVGTMEGCARLLDRIVASDDAMSTSADIVSEHRASGARVPGFGHPTHNPDDPRSLRLFEIAEACGVAGAHVGAVRALAEAVDDAAGKHITLNVTGAIAAVLGDCGVPAEIMRGFALISRCAGLVGHIREEQQRPAMHALWRGAASALEDHE